MCYVTALEVRNLKWVHRATWRPQGVSVSLPLPVAKGHLLSLAHSPLPPSSKPAVGHPQIFLALCFCCHVTCNSDPPASLLSGPLRSQQALPITQVSLPSHLQSLFVTCNTGSGDLDGASAGGHHPASHVGGIPCEEPRSLQSCDCTSTALGLSCGPRQIFWRYILIPDGLRWGSRMKGMPRSHTNCSPPTPWLQGSKGIGVFSWVAMSPGRLGVLLPGTEGGQAWGLTGSPSHRVSAASGYYLMEGSLVQ